MEKDNCNYA